MRVVITGATGLIGRSLIDVLLDRGDEVVALSRDERRARESVGAGAEVHAWPRPLDEPPPEAALAGADGVVHLLGEPVAQRWTAQSKAAIRNSRVAGTRNLVDGLLALAPEHRPAVLVSQSATGYYGPRDDQPVTEDSPAGDDFLAEVVVGWEREALRAASELRVVVAPYGSRSLARGRGAGEDAAVLSPRYRRAGRRRTPVRPLGASRRRDRLDALLA